jgi:hypothetical protein
VYKQIVLSPWLQNKEAGAIEWPGPGLPPFPRRPWSAEVTPNCFIVRDANGQQIAYVYYESEPGRRSAAKLLSKDEAGRIAANIATLPDLFQKALSSPHRDALFADRLSIKSWSCNTSPNTSLTPKSSA